MAEIELFLVAPRFCHSESRKNILWQAVDFSGDVPFSSSEEELSPELSRPMPQVGTDVAQVTAPE